MGNVTVTGICLLAILAGLAGCASNNSPPPQPVVIADYPPDPVDNSFPGLTRVIASDYLLGSIRVVNPKLGNKGNFSKAQVTVQNLTQNSYQLEYQYQWQDQAGFAAGSPRSWQRFALGPQEVRDIAEMALTQDAKQTTFTVRLVDDSLVEEYNRPQTSQSTQP